MPAVAIGRISLSSSASFGVPYPVRRVSGRNRIHQECSALPPKQWALARKDSAFRCLGCRPASKAAALLVWPPDPGLGDLQAVQRLEREQRAAVGRVLRVYRGPRATDTGLQQELRQTLRAVEVSVPVLAAVLCLSLSLSLWLWASRARAVQGLTRKEAQLATFALHSGAKADAMARSSAAMAAEDGAMYEFKKLRLVRALDLLCLSASSLCEPSVSECLLGTGEQRTRE